MPSYTFSKREEIVNAITHGVGVPLAICGLVFLIVYSAWQGSGWHISSFSIFGATATILYVASTLYHSLSSPKIKRLFRKFDHMSIFLLIAGTYTPFCLTILRGWLGWSLFGIVWMCAVTGIVIKVFYTGKGELFSTVLYIAMGWIVLFFIRPVFDYMSVAGFSFLMIGGGFYTVGAFFFIKDKTPYYHSIWHLFVLAGTIFHFFAVMSLL